jgi:Fe-S-cluster containining protein
VDKNSKSPASQGALPEVMMDKRKLGPEDSFCFGCHSKIECFNRCCADINIMLTPLDVLRLSRKAGLSTTDFLVQHTLKPITKDLHLPVVVLKMRDEAERRCPFVSDEGCTVYSERPWACRMYPVGMGLPASNLSLSIFFSKTIFVAVTQSLQHGR